MRSQRALQCARVLFVAVGCLLFGAGVILVQVGGARLLTPAGTTLPGIARMALGSMFVGVGGILCGIALIAICQRKPGHDGQDPDRSE